MAKIYRSSLELLDAITGNTGSPIESQTGAHKTITYPHHEVHAGSAYSASDIVTLGDGDLREILVVTPDTTKWAHMIFNAATALKGQVELFENVYPRYVVANALTPRNRDRNSTNTSGLLVCHTPADNSSSSSGETVEVCLAVRAWGATGLGTNPGFGGESRGTLEWILKQDTSYLLRVTSQAATNVCSIGLNWYEHTNRR